MKKKFGFLFILVFVLFSCSTTQPMSESTRHLMQETDLSMGIPLRFYTWIKVENSNNIQNDIFSGKLDFSYDNSGDFLLKTVSEDGKIMSVWGNQLLLESGNNRYFIFTSFIASTYALESNKDPIDVAFNALNQILSDEAFSQYEDSLIDVFRLGLQQYRIGGTEWEIFKTENFIVEDKTITIK